MTEITLAKIKAVGMVYAAFTPASKMFLGRLERVHRAISTIALG